MKNVDIQFSLRDFAGGSGFWLGGLSQLLLESSEQSTALTKSNTELQHCRLSVSHFNYKHTRELISSRKTSHKHNSKDLGRLPGIIMSELTDT